MRQSPSGVSPTSLAIRTGGFKCLRLLCEKGAKLDEPDGSGMTPSAWALKTQSVACIEVLVEFGAPLGADHKWWEDWHGLSKDGTSLIVRLAVKEKKLDLLEQLLVNSRAAFPEKDNTGVAHKVFGSTDLGHALGSKDAVLLLVENGLTNIDPENYRENEAEEMVKRFKEQGGSDEVTAVQEKLWKDGKQRESEPWSDRSAWQESGKVSGIQVKILDSHDGLGPHISEICFRQGSSWQPWRRTGRGVQGSEQGAFELEEDEAVVAVRTNTDKYSWLRGLEVTTSTGRQVSWGDLDYKSGEKRRSVVENAKLGFCSGLVGTDGHLMLRSIAFQWKFHWMKD